MGITANDIRQWIEDGIEKQAEFLIVACDTFYYENYPVYCSLKEVEEKYKSISTGNMSRVDEVYDLSLNIEDQLKEHRSFHLPGHINT